MALFENELIEDELTIVDSEIEDLDNDTIDAHEAGFMKGYNADIEEAAEPEEEF